MLSLDGSGSGYGSGYKLGTIAKHTVAALAPWRYVRVGCHCHAISWWLANWRAVANENQVSVSKTEVEELRCKVTSCAVGQMAER